ncbi:MAG TPA: response regulator [Gemmatimonadales bacterium]|nr:response regulator [Gemmatimonadales bacterium]
MSDDPTGPQEASGAPAVGIVLVVDDEPLVRRFAARVLEEHGFQIREARDGFEALALLQAIGPGVVCVVSDVVMPGLDGVKLFEAVSLSYPGLPVILMSAYGPAELAERGITSPCAVLSKPFTPGRLIEEVRRCLAERP